MPENCGKLLLFEAAKKKGGRWPIPASTCLDSFRFCTVVERLNTPKIIIFFLSGCASPAPAPSTGSLSPLLIHFTARCHFNCAWVADERAGRAAAAAMMVKWLHLVLTTASTARSNAAPCCRSDQNHLPVRKMVPVTWSCWEINHRIHGSSLRPPKTA